MSIVEKKSGPEILQGYDANFWLRTDEYDCAKWDQDEIKRAAAEFGDEDSNYKPVKVFMRPMTDEENEDIGEENWWTPDDGSDPEAVEYWEFYPIDDEGGSIK